MQRVIFQFVLVGIAWPTWADWFHFVVFMLPVVLLDIRRFRQRTRPANVLTERPVKETTTDGWQVMWD